MVLRSILSKIFQTVQPTFHLLNLVKNNQCLASFRLHTRNGLHGKQNTVDIVVFGKQMGGKRFRITIDIGNIVETSPSKLFHQPSLTHLPGTKQQQRLMPCAVFPLD